MLQAGLAAAALTLLHLQVGAEAVAGHAVCCSVLLERAPAPANCSVPAATHGAAWPAAVVEQVKASSRAAATETAPGSCQGFRAPWAYLRRVVEQQKLNSAADGRSAEFRQLRSCRCAAPQMAAALPLQPLHCRGTDRQHACDPASCTSALDRPLELPADVQGALDAAGRHWAPLSSPATQHSPLVAMPFGLSPILAAGT